ncbi:alpha/beta-hydrolase [Desarmillaria ectypa]|nr:alpha/beta-hydrolase [Desarmillaria ectypa]
MLTSTLLFALLSQLFLTVTVAPAPLDMVGLFNKASNLLDKAGEVIAAGASDALVDILGASGSNTTTSVSSVKILAAGGSGGLIPRFIVPYDDLTHSIVVAHQGTDPSSMYVCLSSFHNGIGLTIRVSIANDTNILLTPIDTEFFPSVAQKGIQVHSGFLDTFLRTASTVLSVVKYGLSTTGATNVILTGHSLGATLDALTNLSIQTTTFGSPRIGNQAFADFVDASFSKGSYARITNKADPVPHVPPTVLEFVHAQGEVHLGEGGAVACEAQENESVGCPDRVGLLATASHDHSGEFKVWKGQVVIRM